MPFSYILIFQRRQSLESSSSSPGGDKHMRPLTFLYEIESLTVFTRRNFWQRSKWQSGPNIKWQSGPNMMYICLHSSCSSALSGREASVLLASKLDIYECITFFDELGVRYLLLKYCHLLVGHPI